MTQHPADYPDWALAELAQHAREHAAALRRLALDAQWLRLWTARVKNARHTSPFALRYDAVLDAGMARLDALLDAERGR